MASEIFRRTMSRRHLFRSTGTALGTLWAMSQLIGIPIPVLMDVERALAQGTTVRPFGQKMFILITNEDGIRPNDFNMQKDAQPSQLGRNWTDAQAVRVQHSEADIKMFPPGIAGLARYGNRMAAVVGVDTLNNSHPGGNMNASTNATAGATATSMHLIVGQASAKSGSVILPGVAFTGTTSYNNGATSGGISPQQFVSSLQVAAGPQQAVLDRMTLFRDSFHKEVVKTLPDSDRKVIERYWTSDAAFKESKSRSQALFNQAAPANTFAGQLTMARRIFNAGIINGIYVESIGPI